ncbi:hypothetical protein B0H63DRAFT_519797 [Podospora didyma]|uniref:Uncharacterized protein n=1 Tax=Podospora didyma TaxID=330526 RepID=A0AAE0NZQ4_9PEZI|nr:hypothetical protein B0H63DRAFT_519797 [Podospora didyma]
MSFSLTNLRALASRLLLSRTMTLTPTTTQLSSSAFFFSTTSAMSAAKSKVPPKPKTKASETATPSRRKGATAKDPKLVQMLKLFAALNPRRIPAPLRMGRNRHLRHWTIHRAWLLFRRREREERERTLMRQYQGMSAACEALRLTEGPGTREEGYLYRVAMEKKGVYGPNGVPIEYAARAQTETPPRVAWNHDWKR